MNNNLKTKDFIFIGIMSVVGMALYSIVMLITMPFGTFGHSISPGVFGLIGGTLFIFMCVKCGKKGFMTIYVLIQMLMTVVMGAGYLPWFISSVTAAVIADLILYFLNYNSLIAQVLAWPIVQCGSAAGAWIPIWFFVDSFKETWISRNQTAEQMEETVKYATGYFGILSVVSVITLSIFGVILGRFILKKYFPKELSK